MFVRCIVNINDRYMLRSMCCGDAICSRLCVWPIRVLSFSPHSEAILM